MFDTFSGPTFDTFSVDLTHLAELTHLAKLFLTHLAALTHLAELTHLAVLQSCTNAMLVSHTRGM